MRDILPRCAGIVRTWGTPKRRAGHREHWYDDSEWELRVEESRRGKDNKGNRKGWAQQYRQNSGPEYREHLSIQFWSRASYQWTPKETGGGQAHSWICL